MRMSGLSNCSRIQASPPSRARSRILARSCSKMEDIFLSGLQDVLQTLSTPKLAPKVYSVSLLSIWTAPRNMRLIAG
ncbi:hypothetical protein GDO86_006563 [Hymenochirus boettgeri]|uniref:Uncharacterized protein n=1 Tax=Hymenochirus boettgeri TaxID=247094 RepID=A0A8T2J948_9PIPI|nr:hypothetical protein GDO86_006563 [Hymenochirus boettgeri]